jgi:type IV secretory pathway VirB2 component (pilin)
MFSHKTEHKLITWLTLVSGFLHTSIVALMHRENFIELWFFAVIGIVQIGLVWYMHTHQEKFHQTLRIIMIINGGLFIMWLATRLFPAPFSIHPEAIGQFDTVIALFEVITIGAAISHLRTQLISRRIIAAILGVAITFGGLNYLAAKGSEKVFRSIPIATEEHPHSVLDVFRENGESHDSSDGHHDDEMMTAPEHDNSDGHHDR